jgi:Flp pilus assembly protein TadD
MIHADRHTVPDFRENVRLHPSSADAWFNLGKALADAGAYAEAVLAYRHSTELDPADASAYYNLGNTLRLAGDIVGAIAAYQTAVLYDSGNAAIHTNLGSAREAAGDTLGAVDAYRAALRCDPPSPEALNNLGGALGHLGLLTQAEDACRAAVDVKPDSASAWYNLAGIIAQQGRVEEAESAYRSALGLQPDLPEALVNLAGVVQELGRPGEAIGLLRQAIALRPMFAEAHYNLSLALLQTGVWTEGWREFEWRHATGEGRLPLRISDPPVWDGAIHPDETLLVREEQGYGDTLQCARFVPLLASRGMRIVLECRKELFPLFAGWGDTVQLSTPDLPVTGVDRVVGMFSLPKLLEVTPDTVPVNVPYIGCPHAARVLWHSRICSGDRAVHVGLVAAGNPAHRNDRNRSIPTRELSGLFGISGIVWHTFLAESDERRDQFPKDLTMSHHGDAIRDFGDTAAIMECLDLVISVDTAAAHLAGALGRPVWILLPFNADWRWLRQRGDSPWYPSARLFRQVRRGDWGSVVARMQEELRGMVSVRIQGEMR